MHKLGAMKQQQLISGLENEELVELALVLGLVPNVLNLHSTFGT